MTVKELKAKLDKCPDNATVIVGALEPYQEMSVINYDEANHVLLDSDSVIITTDIDNNLNPKDENYQELSGEEI